MGMPNLLSPLRKYAVGSVIAAENKWLRYLSFVIILKINYLYNYGGSAQKNISSKIGVST